MFAAAGERAFDVDYLLISDAGAQFDWVTKRRLWWIVSRTVRSTDILMKRVADATLATLTRGIPGIQTIHLPISNIVRSDCSLPAELQLRIAKIRTDLDHFSKTEMGLLVRHGIEIAHDQLKDAFNLDIRLEEVLKSAGDDRLFRGGKRIQFTAKLLDKAGRRSIGLWRTADWASYALVGYFLVVAGLLYLPFALQQARLEATQTTLAKTQTALQQVAKPKPAETNVENKGEQLIVPISPASSNAGTRTVSQPSFTSVLVIFVNHDSEDAELYWVNLTGEEIKYSSLKPNSSQGVTTYVGHLWVARTQNGSVLMKYVVKGSP